jgi:regulatory protein
MPVEYQKTFKEKKPKEAKPLVYKFKEKTFKDQPFKEKKPYTPKEYPQKEYKPYVKPEPKIYTPDEAMLKMEQYCAYQERSPREVQNRIAELGMTGDDADKILQILEGDNYVNETRFAFAYSGGKFRINHWGKVKIGLELRAKGISPTLVNQALAEISDEEYKAVFDKVFANKKAQLESKKAANMAAKLVTYLVNVGFEQDMVYGAVFKD